MISVSEIPDFATLEDVARVLKLFVGSRPNIAAVKKLCLKREIEFIEVTKHNIRITPQALSNYLQKKSCPVEVKATNVERRLVESCTNSLTVGEALHFYLENHIPTTVRPIRGRYNHQILIPFWACLTIEQVTKARCQQYCQLRRDEHRILQRNKRHKIVKEKSNDGLRRELEHLSAALHYAADNGLIKAAPKLWKPDKAKSRQKWFTRKEVARMIRIARSRREAHSYLPLFILLGIYSGARPGAILNLRWSQIDLKNDLIDYRSQQVSKTKGYSIVPIPQKLKRELLRHKSALEARGFFSIEQHVIHNNLSSIGSVKNSFKEICRLAGVDGAVSPNTLRHTHASWLKQRGVPSAIIAENMGHTSPQMVDRTYGHMSKAYIPIIKNAW